MLAYALQKKLGKNKTNSVQQPRLGLPGNRENPLDDRSGIGGSERVPK